MASSKQKNFQVILASQSPRRKELLSYMGFPFEIIPSSIEEKSNKEKIEDWVIDIAEQKAISVFNKIKNTYDNPLVIGSDTIVYLEGRTLGKPNSREEAKKMLQSMMGKKHQVYTGVSCISKSFKDCFYEMSEVTFTCIEDSFLELYLDSNEYADKAGSYGIQGAALPFVERVEGCYSNIVGFPLPKFRQWYQQLAPLLD